MKYENALSWEHQLRQRRRACPCEWHVVGAAKGENGGVLCLRRVITAGGVQRLGVEEQHVTGVEFNGNRRRDEVRVLW